MRKRQGRVAEGFIVINCFIHIVSCKIASNHASSVRLIDNTIDNDKYGKLIQAHHLSSTDHQNSDIDVDSNECYCESNDLNCCADTIDDGGRSDLSSMFLLTAGEVLLGCAIIMGLSAFVTMLLRICTRRRMPQNRRDIPDLMEAFERNHNRASLSSLQQAVMSKLRDRPPRYETRHNYEYRQRETTSSSNNTNNDSNNSSNSSSESNVGGIRSIPILNPNANCNRNEPPPPYDEDNNSVHDLPPAYTINLSAIDGDGGTCSSSSSRSNANQSSITSNENSQQQQLTHRQCGSDERNENEDVRNRTCDTVLYI